MIQFVDSSLLPQAEASYPSPYPLKSGQTLTVTVIRDARISLEGKLAFVAQNETLVGLSDALNYPRHMIYDHSSITTNDLINLSTNYEGDYVLLHTPWSNAYFHWIEQLFKVLILERVGFDGRYIVPTAKFVVESLALLGVDADRIVPPLTASVAVERLWVVPNTSFRALIDSPTLFFGLRDQLLSKAGVRGRARKLFVERGANAASARNIHNYDEVRESLARYDFEPVDFGTLPFADQVELSSNAESFVGMHGGALVNSYWMKRDGLLVEFFSPQYINYCMVASVVNLDLDYVPIVSPVLQARYPHGEDALVPIHLLNRVLILPRFSGHPC